MGVGEGIGVGEGVGVGEGMGVLMCGGKGDGEGDGEDMSRWVVEGAVAEAVGVAMKRVVNTIAVSLEVTFCARAECINQVVRSLNLSFTLSKWLNYTANWTQQV